MMQLISSIVAFSALFAVSLAVPANHHALQPRQTYIITCIGGQCGDNQSHTSTPALKPSTKSTKTPETPTKTIKSTITAKPTTTQETGPSSTSCPVPLYYKCGGWDYDKPWAGCTKCVKGAKCVEQNEWYYQCVADDKNLVPRGSGDYTHVEEDR